MDRYQQAIETIRSNYPPEHYSMLREALNLSLELLEKETLKKPVLMKKSLVCPTCNQTIVNVCPRIDYQPQSREDNENINSCTITYENKIICTTCEIDSALDFIYHYATNVLGEKVYYMRCFHDSNKMNILCVDFGSYSRFFHIISHNSNGFLLKKRKIFISQPMKGLTKEKILEDRKMATCEIKKYFNAHFVDFEIIDVYFEDQPDSNRNPLYFLGKSLELLSEADYIYFVSGVESAKKSRGCNLELLAALDYNVPILNGEIDKWKI